MNKKYVIITVLIFLFSFSFLTIGFAAFTTNLSIEDIGATIRQPLDVRVTNVLLDTASSGVSVENLDYNVKNIMSDIILPENGYITFNVEFTNYVNYPVYLMEIVNLPDNLKYEIDVSKENGYVLENLFIQNHNELRNITITISYKENGYNPNNQSYSLNLGFYFESSYTVLYYENRIPDSYQQLDYIESAGSQYIDTKVNSGNSDLKFELQYSMVKFDASLQYNGIFGAYSSESHNATRMIYRIISENQANSYVYINSIAGNSVLNDETIRTLNTIYTERIERIADDTYYMSNAFDGVKVVNGVPSGTAYDGNIALFNQDVTGNIFSYVRLYYFKIYDGSGLIRDFVPCYRKSDGVVGLYDVVTKEFYMNGGNGNFIAGNEITNVYNQNVLTGKTVPLNKNLFSNNKYVFTGWNTDSIGGGSSYKDEQLIYNIAYNNENVNLYAQWRPFQSKIIYYANGGMGSMENLITSYGGKQTLSSNKFIRNGYVFQGWNTEADGSGINYSNQETIDIDVNNGDVTLSLYAQWEKTLLPIEYAVVEYIESTGTQYINTKVLSGNNDLKFELKYSMSKMPANNSYVGVFGAYSSESHNATRLIYGGNYALVYLNSMAGTSSLKDSVSRKINTIYVETIERKGNTTYYKSSAFDEIKQRTNLPNGTNYAGEIVIFNHSATARIFSSMRLYYFKIYDNDDLIRYFIPCYKKEDGEIGLYDIVTNEFYSNKGTGTFIKGQELN